MPSTLAGCRRPAMNPAYMSPLRLCTFFIHARLRVSFQLQGYSVFDLTPGVEQEVSIGCQAETTLLQLRQTWRCTSGLVLWNVLFNRFGAKRSDSLLMMVHLLLSVSRQRLSACRPYPILMCAASSVPETDVWPSVKPAWFLARGIGTCGSAILVCIGGVAKPESLVSF
jgi:hypothetical protein